MEKRNDAVLFFGIFLLVVLLISPLSSANVFDWVKAKITGRATTQQVTVNITIGNNAPNITSVDSVSAVTLIENTTKSFTINFTAFDAEGSGNLKTVGATANVTKTGSTTRVNSSCNQINTFGTYYANYSCTITMWYYDDYGTWNIGLSVNDTSDARGFNTTATFSVSTLTAFVSSPSALTFSGVNPGSANITSSNDPILLNNTGNDPVSVQINATNLVGETDSNKALYANNFSIAPFGNSGVIECNTTATTMSRSVFASITGATLPNGNFSINTGNESSGQEQLYACLRLAGTELSSQSYSTSNQGAWTIQIV